MRKAILISFIAMIALMVGCDGGAAYKVGDRGPAGGYIFYDCDADNGRSRNDGLVSTECGWRYLEVMPNDAVVSTIFGLYRTTADGLNLFVNGEYYVCGTSNENDGKSTGTAIGTGQANTAKLVEKMGSTAYTSFSAWVTTTTDDYAAKLAQDSTAFYFDDWYLPSRDELALVYKNVVKKNKGNYTCDCYWSSSESDLYSNCTQAWCVYFKEIILDGIKAGDAVETYRSGHCGVILVRAFLED